VTVANNTPVPLSYRWDVAMVPDAGPAAVCAETEGIGSDAGLRSQLFSLARACV
jgi:hypothetical protein